MTQLGTAAQEDAFSSERDPHLHVGLGADWDHSLSSSSPGSHPSPAHAPAARTTGLCSPAQTSQTGDAVLHPREGSHRIPGRMQKGIPLHPRRMETS